MRRPNVYRPVCGSWHGAIVGSHDSQVPRLPRCRVFSWAKRGALATLKPNPFTLCSPPRCLMDSVVHGRAMQANRVRRLRRGERGQLVRQRATQRVRRRSTLVPMLRGRRHRGPCPPMTAKWSATRRLPLSLRILRSADRARVRTAFTGRGALGQSPLVPSRRSLPKRHCNRSRRGRGVVSPQPLAHHPPCQRSRQ